MASLLEQLDLHIRNAAISGLDKQLRILEVRRYLDEIEAEVVSLPIATVAAVSDNRDATLEPLRARPASIATVAAVSANRDVTLEPLRARPASITTVAAVSGIPSPFRTLSSWTPVIEHNGEWLTWRGENYGAVPDSLKAAQEIVKALAKIQFFIGRTCTTNDIMSMCLEVVPLAGGQAAVTNLLRPHLANLKNRSKVCAQKLWAYLENRVEGGNKASVLWNKHTAFILFGYLAAAVDFHYLTGPGLSSIPGCWAAYIYKDFCRNMSAGLDLDFMDGCPTRASMEGLGVPSSQDIPLTSSLIFAPRPSRSAILAMSSPSPTAFDPPIDDDSTPNISELISAVRSTASASDKRFTAGIQKKPARGSHKSTALSLHLASRRIC
jgi:hypothetical protein